ncbi:Vps51/Vps67-domain-containing protein, partial [Neohortaea acidophila]
MSTIASPRPSISSRRTSTSVGDAAPAERSSRRNKTSALRDYYGLKPGLPSDTPPRGSLDVDIEQDSEIDRASFSPATHVEKVLKEQDLAGVLKTEANLVREIWALDGEKKALVYDNYSKLIGATETIKKMRERMETRQMETSTLTPAISHIAETAATLSAELYKKAPQGRETAEGSKIDEKRREEQATVRWALSAPQRLARLVEQGQQAEAERELKDVSSLLRHWDGVEGVDELRSAC